MMLNNEFIDPQQWVNINDAVHECSAIAVAP